MDYPRDQNGAGNRPRLPWLQMLQRVFIGDAQWHPAPPRSAERAPSVSSEPTSPGPCVLVVDDNPVNLMMASALLTMFRIVPVVAADGAEAVALAGELQLDLIMMDLQMPVLDGLGATRQIRQAELARQRRRVPVVAFTSSAPAQQCLQDSGFDGLLDKPCDHDALRACLQLWCPHVLRPVDSSVAEGMVHPMPAARRNWAGGGRQHLNGF